MPGSVTISSELRKDSSLATPGGYISTGERVPVLDGIRGIAILLVMMFHFWAVGTARLSYPLERAYSSIAGMGWIGVDLFFVLSGFLITGILLDLRRNPDYFRIFYGRRTVRIFPLYYAALTVFFLVVPMLLTHLHHQRAFDVETGTAGKLFAWTYLLNWYEGLKGFQIIPHPLQHFWSLAIEEQFYLVWPFLVLKLARRRLIQVCFGLMALGLFMRAVMYWIHLPIAAYTWTICRADPLAAGAIVAWPPAIPATGKSSRIGHDASRCPRSAQSFCCVSSAPTVLTAPAPHPTSRWARSSHPRRNPLLKLPCPGDSAAQGASGKPAPGIVIPAFLRQVQLLPLRLPRADHHISCKSRTEQQPPAEVDAQ